MTWAISRLQEALVDSLVTDATLVSLSSDGVDDEYGTTHHIGVMLNESGLKDRLPFLGVQVVQTEPAIFLTAHSHLFRSTILLHAFSKNEGDMLLLADRAQFLMTSPVDAYCHGFYDFTNAHINVRSTEFQMRSMTEYDSTLDVYTSFVEISVVWADLPCDNEVLVPDLYPCDDPVPLYDDLICGFDCENYY